MEIGDMKMLDHFSGKTVEKFTWKEGDDSIEIMFTNGESILFSQYDWLTVRHA